MEIALIVIGLFMLGVIGAWAFSFISDPKDIDETEEMQVRDESPHEREQARFDEAQKATESNQDDITFYSPGE